MNKTKRVFAGVLAGVLAASISAGTFAAVNNVSQIDTDRKGTINIHKIIENDGRYKEANGLEKDGFPDALPVNNIGFDAAHIATIEDIEGIVISSDGELNLDADAGRVSLGLYYVPCEDLEGRPLPEQLFEESGVFPEAVYILNRSEEDGADIRQDYEELVNDHRQDLQNRQSAVNTARESYERAANAFNAAVRAYSEALALGSVQSEEYEMNSKKDALNDAKAGYLSALSALDLLTEELGIIKVYTASQLEDAVRKAISTINEEQMNSWVLSHTSQKRYTNDSGTAVMSDLELGLYVVAETDISSHDGYAGAWTDGMIFDPASGSWTASDQPELPINGDPDNYYENGTITRDQNTGEVTGNSGKYHIKPIDAFGTDTEHIYSFGELYQESHNPELPVVESKSAPFLVSVPSTNTVDTSEGDVAEGDNFGTAGTVWQYTIDVFPKNQTTGIYKRIIDPDETAGSETLRTSEDYQIGDQIDEIIWADAPVLQKNPHNMHRSFIIADTMSVGLELLSKADPQEGEPGFRVAILPKTQLTEAGSGNIPVSAERFTVTADDSENAGEELEAGVDYSIIITDDEDVSVVDEHGSVDKVIDKGTHGFAVRLLGPGLVKLNNRKSDSVVVVWFQTMLNENAKIGQVQENMNYPTLIYHNSNTSIKKIGGNYVYEYSYELSLMKRGVSDASNVRFIISRKDTGDISQSEGKDLSDTSGRVTYPGQHDSMRFVKEEDGIYHVWTGRSDENTEVSTVNDIQYNTVTPSSDGRLILKGLDSNVYIFREIATEEGKNLLKGSFEVVLKAPDDEEESSRCGILEVATVQTENAQFPTDITIGVAGTGENDSLEGSALNLGIAGMEVNNFDAVDLRTGGSGRIGFYVTGGAIVMLVISGWLTGFRRNRKKAVRNR